MSSSMSKQEREGISDEDGLASDLLEAATLTDETVLYSGARVAMESTFATTKPEKYQASKEDDPQRTKTTKCYKFSVKRPEDKKKVWVIGVLCVSDIIVVIDGFNEVLKLFDQSGINLSSTKLKDCTWGITSVRDSTFATCGFGNTVYLWTVRSHTIVSDDVSYHMDHDADGIHYNGTYYSVLQVKKHAITILDREGRQVRKIKMEKACGKTFEFGFGIHIDSDTNNIYLPFRKENGVLLMTKECQALWFAELPNKPRGITEIQGTLCVADHVGGCLHLITKEGEYIGKLLDKKALKGDPEYTCYGQDGKLYVSYHLFDVKRDIITVFSV